MHAGREVMRSVGKLARHHASPKAGAVLLLAVLVAHLAFMVSPLHTSMPTEGSHAAPPISIDASGDTAAPFVHGAADAPESDCGIEWAKPARETLLAGFLAVAPVSPVPALYRHVPGTRPIARALGPPSEGDPQALLQVFRL